MTPTKHKAATCPFPVKCDSGHIELLCPDCQNERQSQQKKKRAPLQTRIQAAKDAAAYEFWAAKVAEKKKRAAAFKRTRKAIGGMKGIKPARDPQYLAWIRTLPCIISNPIWLGFVLKDPGLAFGLGWVSVSLQDSPTQACHIGKTGKGMRQKCSDYETIPMCQAHHREQHGPDGATFFERHPLDLPACWKALRAAYEEQK